jgi:hypothetical protein
MATQDTDLATAEVGDDAAREFSSSYSSRTTEQRTPGGFDPSLDGSTNAAQQARVSGAASMPEAGRATYDAAKDVAQDVAGRAKEQGRAAFDEQKESAAGTVDSAANAFRNTAQQLRGEGQAQTGHYVEMLADQLQSLGSQLRNKNLDTLIRDAEDFGRRSPGTFLAGSMIAGFVLARFLKSSSEHRHEPIADGNRNDYRRDQSSYGNDEAYRASSVPGWPRDERELLRDQPNAVSTSIADPDLDGTVMEGSDTGAGQSLKGPGLAGAAASPSPIATANEALIEGERHDNR